MKHLIIAIGLIATSLMGTAQDRLREMPIEQLDLVYEVQQKPVVVFLHTEWCTFCKTMENTTFKNSAVIDRLNSDYFFVSFDAETSETIEFFGMTFEPETRGRSVVSSLARSLATFDGKVSYPSTVVLNTNGEIIFQQAGFIDASAMDTILKEISDDRSAFFDQG